jgi:polygalacturonase
MKLINIALVIFILPFTASAKDYPASLFGVMSDGVTLNTRSIQKGIDYINENGGGSLVFYVGRYLTGSIRLKSNVTIKLEEGAVLVGSGSIYDYNSSGSIKAIVSADGQQNIGISGNGVIEGRSVFLLSNMKALHEKGFLQDSLTGRPCLLGFRNCRGVHIDSVNLWDASGAVQQYDNCTHLTIVAVTVKSLSTDNLPGAVFNDTRKVRLVNSYFEVSGKSLQWMGDAKEIVIEHTKDSKGNSVSITP